MSLSTTSIVTNMLAANSARQLGITNDRKAKSSEKLSSGYRINRAGDDAAGLAISEKMRRQIRGLNQGTNNLQDGVSFCQVADGALNEIHDMLLRSEELVIKAANGTMSDKDREYCNAELEQLVDEMDDIFLNTQFNDKYIWRVPYAPIVSGRPNDIQIYNSPQGEPAGVLIENVRFTWNELGFEFNEDGTFKSNEVDITSRVPSGRKCVLTTQNGAATNDVGREYSWSAGDEGIYVNGELAARWIDLHNEDGTYSGLHSFEYHGMTICYDAEHDDLESVKNGINGDGLNYATWRSAVPASKSEYAVTIGNIIDSGKWPYGSSMNVMNSNIAKTHSDSDKPYIIKADENKMWIVDLNDGTVSGEKAWSSFSDITTGNYPFSDWGRPGDVTDQVTMSEAAAYGYSGSLANGHVINFTFGVMDEVSQQAVIKTFNDVVISTHNHNTEVYGTASVVHDEKANVTGTLTDEKLNELKGTTIQSSIMSSYQAGQVVNPDSSISDVNNGTVSLSYGGSIYRGDFTVGTDSDMANVTLYENGDPASGNSLTLSGFHYKVNDQKATISVSSSGTVSGSAQREDFSVSSMSIDFDYQKAKGRNFDSTSDIFGTAGNSIGITRNADGSGTVSMAVGSGTFSGKFAPAEDDARISVRLYENGDTSSSNYIQLENFDLSNPKQSVQINGYQVYQTYNAGFPVVNDNSTSFGVVMNPVMKKLDLQASGKTDDIIRIKWFALTSSVIGMGGADVSSEDGAQATVGCVKYAQQFISSERIKFGAAQNRVEHAINQNRSTSENTTAAESAIRDTDMAKEMVQNAKDNILQQVGQSMLSQANQNRQGMLQLLG